MGSCGSSPVKQDFIRKVMEVISANLVVDTNTFQPYYDVSFKFKMTFEFMQDLNSFNSDTKKELYQALGHEFMDEVSKYLKSQRDTEQLVKV
jgi:hypothetical protein